VVRVGNQERGRRGENEAVAFLVGHRFVILDRNWRCRAGEIDIVAKDGDELVFVEVKARSSLKFGHPFEAVTPTKLARLRVLAGLWREAHPLTAGTSRIDVISVLLGVDPGARPSQVEHLRGVFA
jgi:putative endonuclease